MAHHKSATKRVRQTKKRSLINRARESRVRTFVKKVEKAIAGGDRNAALTAFRAAEPELMRGVRKQVVHRNTAARKLSRLSARIKAMSS
jgi:small subunit ribosomal protein S20